MSNRKSNIAKRFQESSDYTIPDVYKKCKRCGKVIATVWSGWKYKFCPKCSEIEMTEFQDNFGYVSGAFKKSQIEKDYLTNGRRWLKDKCEICKYKDTLDVHRIIPAKDGGQYTIDNVITLCPNCHALITRRKKTLTWQAEGKERIYQLI